MSTMRTLASFVKGRHPGYPASIKGASILPFCIASSLTSLYVTTLPTAESESMRKTGSGLPWCGSRKKYLSNPNSKSSSRTERRSP